MNQELNQVIVERGRKSSVGTVVAIVVGLLILVAIAYYGLPYLMNGMNSETTINVEAPVPAPATGTPSN